MKTTLIAAVLATTFAVPVAAQTVGRPAVPVMVPESGDLDACGMTVVVKGQRGGDIGYVVVVAGPGVEYANVDVLRNGAALTVCDETEDWLAVVYPRADEDCGLGSPAARTAAYAGSCRSGWVRREWVEVVAG